MTFKHRMKTDKTYAATLAKILPDSRLYAFKLLLEKDAKDTAARKEKA